MNNDYNYIVKDVKVTRFIAKYALVKVSFLKNMRHEIFKTTHMR